MQETQQQTVFGESIEQEYHIETTGRVIRPFKQLVTQVIKGGNTAEFVLDITDNGIETLAIDPANVIMVKASINNSVFETYDVEETSIGCANDILGGLLRHARYGVSTNDNITITGNEQYIESTVTRDVHGIQTTFNERQALIDTEAIRETDPIPELDLPAEVDLPPRAFIDIVSELEAEYLNLVSSENSLKLGAETDVTESLIEVGVSPGADVESMYSMKYIEDITKALHVGKVDNMTLRYGDDSPMIVEFDREDTYSGEIVVAPRIQQ